MADLVALNAAQVSSESDPFTAERYRQFAGWFPPRARSVLDVGCNTGRGGQELKALNADLRLTGLDLLQSRLDRLPAETYHDVLCGSATQIPAEDQSYDVVVAGEFIEHLPGPDLMPFLHEAFRVLTFGGVLTVTTPNPGFWLLRRRGDSVLGGSHVSQHHARAIRIELQMAGFNQVKTRGTGRVSHYLGTRRLVPLNAYGSYMAIGHKR